MIALFSISLVRNHIHYILINILKGVKINRLLKAGVSAYGDLISITATNVSINDAPVCKMVYEFSVQDRKYKISVKTHLIEKFSKRNEKLLYDPAHPYEAVMVNSLPKKVRWFLSNKV